MTSVEKRVIWVLLAALVIGIAALQYRNRIARPRLRVERIASVAAARPAKVNLNTADAAALERLPGIGPVLAQAIVAYRAAHGRFSSVDDLANVPGIGAKKLEQFRSYLTTE